MTQSLQDEVEIIEVTDSVEEAKPEYLQPTLNQADQDSVPIEDLVTVFVETMTRVVEFMVITGKNVTESLVKA
ncbi:MAG: hypothetical protein H7839_17970, partial [Magnetococcus sp. YQC-5]